MVGAHGAYRVDLGERTWVCAAVLEVRAIVKIGWCQGVHDTARAVEAVSSMISAPTHRHCCAFQLWCAPIRLSDTGTEPQNTAGHVTLINRFSQSNTARPQSACSLTCSLRAISSPKGIGWKRGVIVPATVDVSCQDG
ncbi:hypothetical protein ACQP0C_00675 [Nocardia sp. CA-129566]|uniref:hypothetical protein n=1 Tax=Nocardia sp. CA-129566 TaxID=3239976 RepID=UPI003D9A0926